MGYNVSVDNDKCVGCGEYVDVCPVEVYEIKGRRMRRPRNRAHAWAFRRSNLFSRLPYSRNWD